MRLVSEPGLGSSFTLHLPLEQVRAPVHLSPFGELSPNIVYVVSPLRELAECYCAWLRRWGTRAHLGPPSRVMSRMMPFYLSCTPGLPGHCLSLAGQGL